MPAVRDLRPARTYRRRVRTRATRVAFAAAVAVAATTLGTAALTAPNATAASRGGSAVRTAHDVASRYDRAVLAAHPVACWLLNGTGTDLSGVGHSATYRGGRPARTGFSTWPTDRGRGTPCRSRSRMVTRRVRSPAWRDS